MFNSTSLRAKFWLKLTQSYENSLRSGQVCHKGSHSLLFFFFLKKHNVLEFCLREASVLFKDLMMDKSIFLVLHGDSLKSLHLCT